MAGPYDYGINVASPFQSALQGYQAGAAIRDDGLQAQQKQLELQAQQAKMQAAQRQQEMLGRLAANPNATADDYASVMTQIPALAENLTKAWNVRSAAQQQTHTADLLKWGAAIKSGEPQIAVAQMRERAGTMEAAGQPQQAAALRANAGVLEQNPRLALGMIQAQLASSPLGKDAAETLSKFGTEERAGAQEARTAELHPSNLAESQAKAQSAITGAKFAESKAVQDLQLGAAQIKKMAEDTEIARMNARIAAMNAATSREGNDLKKQELRLKVDDAIAKRDEKVREKNADFQAGHAVLSDAMKLISEIKQNKVGLAGATGATSWGSIVPGTPSADAAAKIEQLENLLAAGNLDKLKGPMSDKDIVFLKRISANLNRKQSSEQFLKELDKVEDSVIRNEKILRGRFGSAARPVAESAPTGAPTQNRGVTVEW